MRFYRVGMFATLVGMTVLFGNLLVEPTPAMSGFEPIAIVLIILGFFGITHDRFKMKEEKNESND